MTKGANHIFYAYAKRFTKPPMTISWQSDYLENDTNTETEWLNSTSMIFGRTNSTFEIRHVTKSGRVVLTYSHASFSSPQTVIFDVTGKFVLKQQIL